MIRSFIFPISVLLSLILTPLAAQEIKDSTLVLHKRITLVDGSEMIGVILEDSTDTIVFKTVSGISMTIPKAQIKEIKIVAGTVVGTTLYRLDPNHTRLFFAPTGRALRSGQGYFAAYEVFFPWIGVGLSNYLTLAGGITLFPGAEEQMYYFAPKVTFFEKSNLSLSGGVLYLSFTGSEGYFGVYYGVGTYGSQKASLTAGLGYSFANEKNAEDPIVMLGIDVQISSRLKFISENWFFSGGTNLNTFGIRFFGEALAADFALMRIPEMESGFPFFPWISFAYNFGTQHMTQQTGDRGIPEPVRYPSPTCRISLHYVPMSSANPYKEKLEQLLGTSSSIQGDDLFDKGDSETSKGTRLSLSAEYSMTDELAAGISISSLGALIGSPATTQLEKSIVGGQSPSYYYGNYNFYAQYSFLSGSAIISYVPFRLFTDDNSTTMRIGCGLGLTEIYVGFKSKLPWGGGDISGLIDKVDTRKMNGVAYASIDKRVTTLLGIGLSVEYFYLQSVNVPETIFETGIIRYDYSTNPPTQTPITDILPVHSINFSEVRIAL